MQLDTPGNILVKPASLQVAGTVGMKNILSGIVVADGQVRIGECEIGVPSEPAMAIGQRFYLCLPSERIILIRPEHDPDGQVENALHGELVDEFSDGMNVTLFFRAVNARLRPTEPYDLQIDVPVYIYERLALAHQRTWTVSLRKRSMHLIPDDAH